MHHQLTFICLIASAGIPECTGKNLRGSAEKQEACKQSGKSEMFAKGQGKPL
jgi:hypothetical protein